MSRITWTAYPDMTVPKLPEDLYVKDFETDKDGNPTLQLTRGRTIMGDQIINRDGSLETKRVQDLANPETHVMNDSDAALMRASYTFLFVIITAVVVMIAVTANG